jgi:plastocyanin
MGHFPIMKHNLFLIAVLTLCACSRTTVAPSNYHEIEVKDGGSIAGRVTYNGAKPAADPVIVQKDQDACGVWHPNPSNPGSGDGIAGVVVYLDTITEGKPFSEFNTPATLDQRGCEFLPHTQIVKLGTKIVVTNSDKVLHNFHFYLNGKTVMNEPQPEGAPPREVVLPDPGLNIVHCDVHPWMRGFVMVAEHPYYAIADSTGHYTLSNVPPGTYTVKMWRDSWVLNQPKGPNGDVISYDWGDDFHNQKIVEVQANASTTVDFVMP